MAGKIKNMLMIQPFSQEDILFTASPYDIWRSNYLIAVIKNGRRKEINGDNNIFNKKS